MRWVLVATVATFASLSLSNAAAACTVSGPPFDPNLARSDAVLLARVTRTGRAAWVPFADVEVRRVLAGRHAGRSLRLDWRAEDAAGPCAPPRPELRRGQAVVVYLGHQGHTRLQNWLPVADAIGKDHRVRAALRR